MATVVTTGPPTHTTTTVIQKEESGMRRAIPQLPLPLAIACCVLNFVLPGVGTIVAGFSIFCCGNVGESDASKVGTFCINFFVGLLQMGSVILFLFGWFWSIMWGYAILAMAGDGNDTTVITTTNTVQPQPATVYQPQPAPVYQPQPAPVYQPQPAAQPLPAAGVQPAVYQPQPAVTTVYQ